MARKMAHFRYDPVKGQKIVKLPENTDPVICDMDGARREIGQLTIFKKLATIVIEHDSPSVCNHAPS